MIERGLISPGHGQVRRNSSRPWALGGALRRAWIGYQHRLDEAMAAAGFSVRRSAQYGAARRIERDLEGQLGAQAR